MSDVLRVLFIEDSPFDHELEERVLRDGGLKFVSRRVQTREELRLSLKDFSPELILSDFHLPELEGFEALALVRDLDPHVPFIFVSGTIGEERAIDSLRRGATDYVVKDRLGGLVIRAQRALEESRNRKRKLDLEEQLRQSQKMEAVGRLAGGVAHDFNNLLTVINGYSQAVLDKLAAGDPVRADAEEVLRAGERASHLTRQLLAFSRKQVMTPRVLNLNKTVREIERMLNRLIGEDVELVTRLDEQLGNVRADAGLLEQVCLNLAVNARDAMPNGGTLTLETANVDLDEQFAREHADVAPGRYVRLLVRDTGVGMDREVRSHLFEPFFTTKEPGKGTGLGLSTAYGIVKQSGGTISVRSEPGQGAVFEVYLPRVEQAAAAPARPEPSRPAPSPTGTILLVEDSDAVRRLMTATLSRAGYDVLSAESGEKALAFLQGLDRPLQLLITDIMLPRMGGREVAHHVTRARPDVRVLYTSGNTEIGTDDALPPGRSVGYLQKPFRPSDLLQKIAEILRPPDAR